MKTINVYNQHGGSNIKLPAMTSLNEVRQLAEASAARGHDAFYRVFDVVPYPTSISGEKFRTAFSVLGGVVKEHPSVTFPSAHW